MEEIKVGEYIRTKDGVIAKVTYVDVMMVDCDRDVFDLKNLAMMEIPTEYIEEYIVKHSFDIKDLLQAGDIIMYKQYKFSKFYDIELVREYTDARTQKKYLGVKGFRLKESQIEIKEILTKEQFNQMKYIVGGE